MTTGTDTDAVECEWCEETWTGLTRTVPALRATAHAYRHHRERLREEYGSDEWGIKAKIRGLHPIAKLTLVLCVWGWATAVEMLVSGRLPTDPVMLIIRLLPLGVVTAIFVMKLREDLARQERRQLEDGTDA